MPVEFEKLSRQIEDWNANRLDLFNISFSNEIEFNGVIRFYFQDTGAKVSTKCLRVSSNFTTREIIEQLIEKFRPDMRMLSSPQDYSLYEVFATGEERKLHDDESPLYVQLNWGKDDREGRFLLKNENDKTIKLGKEDEGTKRKTVSKKDKKEEKRRKKTKKGDTPQKSNAVDGGIAKEIYSELPETSFTRTISNPEAVMRKRRELKIAERLKADPKAAGTLKIYGTSLNPDVPYKTILLSSSDTVEFVIKDVLEKYGLGREDWSNFCLVQVKVPRGAAGAPANVAPSEQTLSDRECPWSIFLDFNSPTSEIQFHLRRRTRKRVTNRPPAATGRSSGDRLASESQLTSSVPNGDGIGALPSPEMLPFLLELKYDGTDLPPEMNPQSYPLYKNMTEIGSDQTPPPNTPYIQLTGPNVLARHCVITHTDEIVGITPSSPAAQIFVNGQLIEEFTVLTTGTIIRLGDAHYFRFVHPLSKMHQSVPDHVLSHQQQRQQQQQQQPSKNRYSLPLGSASALPHPGSPDSLPNDRPHSMMPLQSSFEEPLPASIDFKEDAEEAFLSAMTTELQPSQLVKFKLAPAYSLYMAARYRVSPQYRPDYTTQQRNERLSEFLRKSATLLQHSVDNSRNDVQALLFWLANASELLNFYKYDQDLFEHCEIAQRILADIVRACFDIITAKLMEELEQILPEFFADDDSDLDIIDNSPSPQTPKPIDNVLAMLSSVISLFRRCRLNASLTIQIFSQLFHYMNQWLFNRMLHHHTQLCTQQWAARIKGRLSRVESWAEKQGLELAADSHLAKVEQAAQLLLAPKNNLNDIAAISSQCYKLNSAQIRVILTNFVNSSTQNPNTAPVVNDLVHRLIVMAESTADKAIIEEGRQVTFEEDPKLRLPFLLPDDGYSSDVLKEVPPGLHEFLDPFCQIGLCRLHFHSDASGLWNVYLMDRDNKKNSPSPVPGAGGGSAIAPQRVDPALLGLPPEPDIITLSFHKLKQSMGLSIIAAKGDKQEKRGIYIKSVVPGGAADQAGQLHAGDQILKVGSTDLTGMTQEKAARVMQQTGDMVTLTVAKQAAIYHNLSILLSQPSPPLPHKGFPAAGVPPSVVAASSPPAWKSSPALAAPSSPVDRRDFQSQQQEQRSPGARVTGRLHSVGNSIEAEVGPQHRTGRLRSADDRLDDQPVVTTLPRLHTSSANEQQRQPDILPPLSSVIDPRQQRKPELLERKTNNYENYPHKGTVPAMTQYQQPEQKLMQTPPSQQQLPPDSQADYDRGQRVIQRQSSIPQVPAPMPPSPSLVVGMPMCRVIPGVNEYDRGRFEVNNRNSQSRFFQLSSPSSEEYVQLDKYQPPVHYLMQADTPPIRQVPPPLARQLAPVPDIPRLNEYDINKDIQRHYFDAFLRDVHRAAQPSFVHQRNDYMNLPVSESPGAHLQHHTESPFIHDYPQSSHVHSNITGRPMQDIQTDMEGQMARISLNRNDHNALQRPTNQPNLLAATDGPHGVPPQPGSPAYRPGDYHEQAVTSRGAYQNPSIPSPSHQRPLSQDFTRPFPENDHVPVSHNLAPQSHGEPHFPPNVNPGLSNTGDSLLVYDSPTRRSGPTGPAGPGRTAPPPVAKKPDRQQLADHSLPKVPGQPAPVRPQWSGPTSEAELIVTAKPVLPRTDGMTSNAYRTEQKEGPNRQRTESAVARARNLEIQRLEAAPDLSQVDQERLVKLKIQRDFQQRAEQISAAKSGEQNQPPIEFELSKHESQPSQPLAPSSNQRFQSSPSGGGKQNAYRREPPTVSQSHSNQATQPPTSVFNSNAGGTAFGAQLASQGFTVVDPRNRRLLQPHVNENHRSPLEAPSTSPPPLPSGPPPPDNSYLQGSIEDTPHLKGPKQVSFNDSVQRNEYRYSVVSNASSEGPPTPTTPQVIGAQEVYIDPKLRIQSERDAAKADKLSSAPGEKLSFKEKMSLFAKEIGENTPPSRVQMSRSQRNIETGLGVSGTASKPIVAPKPPMATFDD